MENQSVLWEELSLSKEEGNLYKSGSKEQFGGKVLAAKFFYAQNP